MDAQLPGFLHSLAPLLNHYGYLAVAVVVLIESFGPPLPGETVIIAASIYAGAGTLNIWAVAVIAFAAAVVGDNVGFAIGRRGGRALVGRYGKYVGATPERFATAERFFVRHGHWIVVVARFIEGLRQLNGIIAGTSGMRWRTFAASQSLGAAIWVACWTAVGYTAGSHITAIYDTFARAGYALVGVLVVAVVWLLLRRRRRSHAAAAARDDDVTPVG
ncbi:MAG TPA: DedA family protein [Mycobacteriales bacterium]